MVLFVGHLLKDVRSYKKEDLISTPALGKQSVFRKPASGCWAYGPFDLKHRSALQNGESWTRGRLLCPLAVCSYRHCYENTHKHAHAHAHTHTHTHKHKHTHTHTHIHKHSHTHSIQTCLPCVFLRIYLDSRCV